jgi:hypothetical protein
MIGVLGTMTAGDAFKKVVIILWDLLQVGTALVPDQGKV